MACEKCLDLSQYFTIESVFDLSKAFRVVRANLADDTIRLVSGALPPGQTFGHDVEATFSCTACPKTFELRVGPEGAGAGHWFPLPDRDQLVREAKARRKARLARFPKRGSLAETTHAMVKSRLDRAGFGSRIEDLMAIARPCVQLEPWPCRPRDVKPMCSRIGGEPYLPPDFAWPHFAGAPLDFLCQLNLEELPEGVLAELPRSGLLSFFYATGDNPWGDDPAHTGSALVHFHESPDPSSLSRFDADPEIEDVPGCHGIRFVPGVHLPSAEDPVLEGIPGGAFEGSEHDTYFDLVQTLVVDHHVMGYPDPLQGHDMREDCAASAPAGLAGAPRDSWRLLLQLGGDTHPLGLPWDGSGRLYFWVPDPDLQARDFGRCWATFQAT